MHRLNVNGKMPRTMTLIVAKPVKTNMTVNVNAHRLPHRVHLLAKCMSAVVHATMTTGRPHPLGMHMTGAHLHPRLHVDMKITIVSASAIVDDEAMVMDMHMDAMTDMPDLRLRRSHEVVSHRCDRRRHHPTSWVPLV